MVDGKVDLRTLGHHHLNLAIDCSVLRIWRVPRPPPQITKPATPNREKVAPMIITGTEYLTTISLPTSIAPSGDFMVLSSRCCYSRRFQRYFVRIYYDYDIVVAGFDHV